MYMKECCVINVYLNEVYRYRQNFDMLRENSLEILYLKKIYGMFLDSTYIGCGTFIVSGMNSCPLRLIPINLLLCISLPNLVNSSLFTKRLTQHDLKMNC